MLLSGISLVCGVTKQRLYKLTFQSVRQAHMKISCVAVSLEKQNVSEIVWQIQAGVFVTFLRFVITTASELSHCQIDRIH